MAEGGAELAYRLNKSGKYHAMAEALKRPIAKFVQAHLGLMPLEHRNTAAGDRYVTRAYRLTLDLAVRVQNSLFRGAELYQDQSTEQREAAEVLKKLEAELDRVKVLAADAEAAGRLNEAETRLRLRVK